MKLYEYQMSRSFIDLLPKTLRFNIYKRLFLRNARPIEAKFHVEPPWDEEMKMNTNGSSHMTKMTAMPIYVVKTFKHLFFLEPKGQ